MSTGLEVGTRFLRRSIATRWPARQGKLPLVVGTVGALVAPVLAGLLVRRGAGEIQKRMALRASAIGAAAVGALAIGAMSIGALAIARLSVRSMRISRLRVDQLDVRHTSGTWMPAAQV